MKAIRKAEQSVVAYQKNQLRIMNVVLFITLFRRGYNADEIVERFNLATEIWQESRQKRSNTLALLEEETGIELALDGEKSYTEFTQLAHREKEVTPEEYIYALHRRKRWFAPMFLACMLLALRRKDNLSDEALAEIASRSDEIRKDNGEDAKVYKTLMERETGYTPKLWGE